MTSCIDERTTHLVAARLGTAKVMITNTYVILWTRDKRETIDFRAHSEMDLNKRVRSLRGRTKRVEGWEGGDLARARRRGRGGGPGPAPPPPPTHPTQPPPPPPLPPPRNTF